MSSWDIDLDYCDIEWFALEMNRDLSVIFENIPKYCISDYFVDYEGYSIPSQRFLPTVVDILVILNSSIPFHFSSLIPKMSLSTLAISCLTTSNLADLLPRWEGLMRFKNYATASIFLKFCSII